MGRPSLGAGCHLPGQPENIDCSGCAGRARTDPHHDFCACRKGDSVWNAGFGGQVHAIQMATPWECIMAALAAGATAYAAVHRLAPLGQSTCQEDALDITLLTGHLHQSPAAGDHDETCHIGHAACQISQKFQTKLSRLLISMTACLEALQCQVCIAVSPTISSASTSSTAAHRFPGALTDSSQIHCMPLSLAASATAWVSVQSLPCAHTADAATQGPFDRLMALPATCA